jgi:hypothetical protein
MKNNRVFLRRKPWCHEELPGPRRGMWNYQTMGILYATLTTYNTYIFLHRPFGTFVTASAVNSLQIGLKPEMLSLRNPVLVWWKN